MNRLGHKYFTTAGDPYTGADGDQKRMISVMQSGEESSDPPAVKIGEWESSATTGPFHPFKQGDREYALFCPHYERLAIMSLPDCKVVWTEPDDEDHPDRLHFCPLEFLVPTTERYDYDLYRKPYVDDVDGRFAFMTGCYWGAESYNPVFFLDLRELAAGKVTVDQRFGCGDVMACLEDSIRIRKMGMSYGDQELTVRVGFGRFSKLTDDRNYDPEKDADAALEAIRNLGAVIPEESRAKAIKILVDAFIKYEGIR